MGKIINDQINNIGLRMKFNEKNNLTKKVMNDNVKKINNDIDIDKLGDSGYQGIKDIHFKSKIPIKKSKGKKLTKWEKKFNHLLSKRRILVENVIRKCKIFRITKDTYRGKHKNYGKT